MNKNKPIPYIEVRKEDFEQIAEFIASKDKKKYSKLYEEKNFEKMFKSFYGGELDKKTGHWINLKK